MSSARDRPWPTHSPARAGGLGSGRHMIRPRGGVWQMTQACDAPVSGSFGPSLLGTNTSQTVSSVNERGTRRGCDSLLAPALQRGRFRRGASAANRGAQGRIASSNPDATREHRGTRCGAASLSRLRRRRSPAEHRGTRCGEPREHRGTRCGAASLGRGTRPSLRR